MKKILCYVVSIFIICISMLAYAKTQNVIKDTVPFKYSGKFNNGTVTLVVAPDFTGRYVTHFTINKNDGCQYQSKPEAQLTGSKISLNWAKFSWKTDNKGQVAGIIGTPGSYAVSNVHWKNLQQGKCHFSQPTPIEIHLTSS